MKMKFFIPLFLMLPLLRGDIPLVEKENEITKAVNELKKEEITTESIDKIIVLIDELEKLAKEDFIASENEDEEDEDKEEDIQEFQELRMLLVALQEYINSPSEEVLWKLIEWGEYRPEDCVLIEKAKKQIMVRN